MGILLSPTLAKQGKKDYFRQNVLSHYCEACDELHSFSCEERQTNSAIWSWNGDSTKPTFSPSMLITIHSEPAQVCHYFLRDGMIEYLPDCTHRLAGQTVPLISIPDKYLRYMKMNEMREPRERRNESDVD